MLHLNTKYCAVRGGGAGTTLAVSVGRKFDQPLSDAQRIDFVWQPPVSAADYMSARLSADKGPLSTRDYRIEFEATPLPNGKTFIHLAYAYAYGTAARIAMQGYLSTLGSDKVGFSAKDKDASGQPILVGGVLGVVERNTMRYYLAIDAYLDSPAEAELPKRLAPVVRQHRALCAPAARDGPRRIPPDEAQRIQTAEDAVAGGSLGKVPLHSRQMHMYPCVSERIRPCPWNWISTFTRFNRSAPRRPRSPCECSTAIRVFRPNG